MLKDLPRTFYDSTIFCWLLREGVYVLLINIWMLDLNTIDMLSMMCLQLVVGLGNGRHVRTVC